MDNNIKIVSISNIELEPYFLREAEKSFGKYGKNVSVVYLQYEECTEEIYKEVVKNADTILAALNFEVLYPDFFNGICAEKYTNEEIKNDAVQKCASLYSYLKEISSATVVWLGFEDFSFKYYTVFGSIYFGEEIVDGINLELNKIINNRDALIDLKKLIARVGTDNAYSSKGKYRWNSPYSRALISLVCGELAKKHLINHGITKKCVVLDCDNVLWGGILSEDGIEGIKLGEGSRYREFQKFLLTLYYHGVILAICSKNDEEEVLRVFREHSGMLLKEENIASIKANWNNKPDNIKRIAEELNIGLDSIVFVDDEEFEINSVRYMVPDVTAVLYNEDTVYSELSCFNLEGNIDTESVKQRNETYRTDKYRREILDSSLSHEEYLKELDTKIDIHKAAPTEYSRIAELSQRANRCTNGKRYTPEELMSKIKAGYILYSVTAEDRFSNLGLVGAIGIEANRLDMFVLSCRAIGRNIENAMLEFLKNEGIWSFFFDTTGKNFEIKKFLINLKFLKTIKY